ncbi:ABC transporter ATP-binding protein [Streptomyces sp. R302]|uniref:ABC transporter ATP-binding protein n=1 Tax=unclassified Streptomyces TaxID=2593676 RepID=UPI00145E067D|nr:MULTISPECIES: ABC transporter ATP-binding protein [unclassified Streptomyces]NML50147.1 ABC transporter ATP-binding protein [Streptomyces sp. R301]NML79138.1 ABC transporter ATP-binding protein [Streptomyces sp. R302]
MTATTTGIQVRALRKDFPVRDKGLFGPRGTKRAVDGLDLDIPPGRITGLLGLNGAGKTTTIKILATLLRPTSGTVRVDGLDTVADARAVRRRINLIAGGERMVYTRMTGRENLRYFGRLYDVPTPELRTRIDELLDLVGLTDAADTTVERYSRGMTQRLAIARGLINSPDYLLLDEPTLGLDAPIARDLRRVVAALAAAGTGVLLTSHYLAEVEELCGHVYVISGGRHLAQGSPAELKTATGSHRTVRVTVTDPGDHTAAVATRFGATREPLPNGAEAIVLRHPGDMAGPLAAALVEAGGSIGGLEITEASLEDAILRLADGTATPPASPASEAVTV